MSFNKNSDDPYEVLEANAFNKSNRRKTIRQRDTPFPVHTYGTIRNMSRILKIPKQRNSYLREAFFKCYLEGKGSGINFKPEDVLRRFAKLFYYHQELRIETRKIFDHRGKELLIENEYTALKEILDRWVFDGCKTLEELPMPDYANKPKPDDFENEKLFYNAGEEWVRGRDTVNITFNHKKRDFPRSQMIFIELAKNEIPNIKEQNEKTIIKIIERDHSGNNYLRISNLLWTQSIALIVRDTIEEIEKEIVGSGVHYAYIELPTIRAAIDHFNQTSPRAKEMTIHEKAYSITHRYKDKLSDEPFKYDSVKDKLRKMSD